MTLDGSGDGYYQFSDWMDLYYINAVGGEGPCTEWSTLGTIPPQCLNDATCTEHVSK